MYIKNKASKEIQFNNKILLVNLRNGKWLRTSIAFFNVLNNIYESDKLEDLIKSTSNETIIKNLKTLLDNLIHIEYFVDENYQYTESLSVTITLTHKCNLSCNHCVLSSSPQSPEKLSTNEVQYLLDQVIETSPDVITLSGGEPFIRKDIYELISYIRKKFKNKLVIITNGLLIRKSKVSFLSENVNALDISLDGYDEESVSAIRGNKVFSRVVKKIQALKHLNFNNISLSCVLTKFNYYNKQKFENLCNELGVKCSFRPFHPDGRAIKNINNDNLIPTDILFENYDCYHCKPGSKEFVIDHEGNVYPCTNLINNQFNFGNLFKDSNLLQKMKYDKNKFELIFNKIDSLRPVNDDTCKNCKVNLFCWECPSRYQSIKNNSDKLKEFCRYKKKVLYKEIWGELI